MRSVYIADDDSLVRESLSDLTSGMGCRVRTGASGEEALAAFGMELSDLLISDVDMPDISGFALVQRLHDMDCHPRFILMSARTEAELAGEAERIGALCFLQKPIELLAYAGTLKHLFHI